MCVCIDNVLVSLFTGIFQPHIRHLLVLATPVDIVILGLSYATLQPGKSNAFENTIYLQGFVLEINSEPLLVAMSGNCKM